MAEIQPEGTCNPPISKTVLKMCDCTSEKIRGGQLYAARANKTLLSRGTDARRNFWFPTWTTAEIQPEGTCNPPISKTVLKMCDCTSEKIRGGQLYAARANKTLLSVRRSAPIWLPASAISSTVFIPATTYGVPRLPRSARKYLSWS